ncbi:alpha/beta fold hydrolase [Promicromonospora panici]|uniref:alpha/beta fold hydrolase n=1 Tax=Promicromonospora panici TaxID=2219658 RepID=UPI001F5CD985|nr:alpha/beta fold hydrolase [Promicromonospora panici]
MNGRGMPASVLDAYDLIGMDPRGVGHSSPVSCGFTMEQNYPGNVPPYAEDAAAVAEQAKAARRIADQCAANDPEGRMQHMTTANTARDMDVIRTALGEDRLSFYGASYGSALGSAYASLFPERSDRVVVDSNLGATSLDQGALRRFGLGMEDRFPDFAKWAAPRHESYGLGTTRARYARPSSLRRTSWLTGPSVASTAQPSGSTRSPGSTATAASGRSPSSGSPWPMATRRPRAARRRSCVPWSPPWRPAPRCLAARCPAPRCPARRPLPARTGRRRRRRRPTTTPGPRSWP